MNPPQFPQGQITPDDEGETLVAIAADPKRRLIFIRFPKPVTWVGLPLEEARQFRDLLIQRIGELEAGHN